MKLSFREFLAEMPLLDRDIPKKWANDALPNIHSAFHDKRDRENWRHIHTTDDGHEIHMRTMNFGNDTFTHFIAKKPGRSKPTIVSQGVINKDAKTGKTSYTEQLVKSSGKRNKMKMDSFYGHILKHSGVHAIRSDETHSPGAKDAWEKMTKNSEVKAGSQYKRGKVKPLGKRGFENAYKGERAASTRIVISKKGK